MGAAFGGLATALLGLGTQQAFPVGRGIAGGTGLLVSWFGIMGLFNLPTTWFWKNIVQRGLLSVFPGSGSVFGHNGNIAHSVAGSSGMDFMDLGNTYQLLASANLWIGVVIGLGLLAGAIWFRRWRDDS